MWRSHHLLAKRLAKATACNSADCRASQTILTAKRLLSKNSKAAALTPVLLPEELTIQIVNAQFCKCNALLLGIDELWQGMTVQMNDLVVTSLYWQCMDYAAAHEQSSQYCCAQHCHSAVCISSLSAPHPLKVICAFCLTRCNHHAWRSEGSLAWLRFKGSASTLKSSHGQCRPGAKASDHECIRGHASECYQVGNPKMTMFLHDLCCFRQPNYLRQYSTSTKASVHEGITAGSRLPCLRSWMRQLRMRTASRRRAEQILSLSCGLCHTSAFASDLILSLAIGLCYR